VFYCGRMDDEQAMLRALPWAVATIELIPGHLRTQGEVDEMSSMRAVLYAKVGRDAAESSVNTKLLRILGGRSEGD
jgi:hypothetical protein